MKFYVLKDVSPIPPGPEDKRYIAIDQASGGYPYRTSIKNAKIWSDNEKESLIRYRNQELHKDICPYQIYEVEFKLTHRTDLEALADQFKRTEQNLENLNKVLKDT